VFQAIRIEVNDEISPLYNTVRNSIKCLKSGGRLCIITFHSLEDRAVKNAYIDAEGKCTCPPELPYCVCNYVSEGKIITKKPIYPSDEYQYDTNPRKIKPEYKVKPEKVKNKPNNKMYKKNRNKRIAETKRKAKIIFYLLATFTIIFTISYRNTLIDEAYSKTESLKNDLSNIEKENEQIEVNIENSINLSNIERVAREKLGMTKLSNKQTVYITLPKQDYIESENKTINKKKTLLERIKDLF